MTGPDQVFALHMTIGLVGSALGLWVFFIVEGLARHCRKRPDKRGNPAQNRPAKQDVERADGGRVVVKTAPGNQRGGDIGGGKQNKNRFHGRFPGVGGCAAGMIAGARALVDWCADMPARWHTGRLASDWGVEDWGADVAPVSGVSAPVTPALVVYVRAVGAANERHAAEIVVHDPAAPENGPLVIAVPLVALQPLGLDALALDREVRRHVRPKPRR